MFLSLQGRSRKQAAARAYGAAVTQSRQPWLYAEARVPDTVDGRFDSICLHIVLLVERLEAEGREGRAMAQALFDQMFLDMDRSLREMGVGDLSVPRHMKRMMTALHGRADAYRAAFAAGGQALDDALARNLYGTADRPGRAVLDRVKAYIDERRGALAAQPGPALLAGDVNFQGGAIHAKKSG